MKVAGTIAGHFHLSRIFLKRGGSPMPHYDPAASLLRVPSLNARP